MKKIKKRYLLTDEDFELYQIIITSASNDFPIGYYLEFMMILKNRYKINYRKSSIFADIDANLIESKSSFLNENSNHVSRVYIELLRRLISSSNVQDHELQEKTHRSLINYCTKLIKWVEQEDLVLNFHQEAGKHLFLLLLHSILIERALAKSDYRAMSKIYLQSVQFIEEIDSSISEISEYTNHFKNMLCSDEQLNNIMDDLQQINFNYIKHPKQIEAYKKAFALADDLEPCLIIGETGTGKEDIARTIHKYSPRKKNMFWPVNCGGFTDSLYNSQVQGVHKKAASGEIGTRLGAFLTACGRGEVVKKEKNDRIGYYIDDKENIKFKSLQGKSIEPNDENLKEVAGTLFLDEINSLSIDHQTTLLRIIQERKVEVVGEQLQRPFNLKLVCASNSTIGDLVKKDKFREDLYYRIARGIIELPPLRELKDYMEDYVEMQITKLCINIGIENEPVATVSAINKLKKYDWPGNLRELENVLYRSLIQMSIDDDKELMPKHIELLYKKHKISDQLDFGSMTHAAVEKCYIQHMLNLSNGVKVKAAKKAKIQKSKFQRMIKKYDLS